MKMKPYAVRQGDYLARLAGRMGFSADAVWNDPRNAELKELRGNGDVLYPGDLLYVPDAAPEPMDLAAKSNNRFEAKVPVVTLDLVFSKDEQPLAGEPYEVHGLPDRVEGTSGGDGGVKLTVPVSVHEVRVVFPKYNAVYPIRVGHLDPIDELSGVRMRLENLGFYRGLGAVAPDDESDAARALDQRAVRAFQAAHNLPVTGEVDDATRGALRDAHGS